MITLVFARHKQISELNERIARGNEVIEGMISESRRYAFSVGETMEQMKIELEQFQEHMQLTHSADEDTIRVVSVDKVEWKVTDYIRRKSEYHYEKFPSLHQSMCF